MAETPSPSDLPPLHLRPFNAAMLHALSCIDAQRIAKMIYIHFTGLGFHSPPSASQSLCFLTVCLSCLSFFVAVLTSRTHVDRALSSTVTVQLPDRKSVSFPLYGGF